MLLLALLLFFLLFCAYRRCFPRARAVGTSVLPSALSGWQSVHVDTQRHRVQLLSDWLDQRGIRAVIIDKKDSVYPWGAYELHVPHEHWERAKDIAKSFNEKV